MSFDDWKREMTSPSVAGSGEEPERTCPSPGGCDSCPSPEYCRGLRVGIGITDGAAEPGGRRYSDDAIRKAAKTLEGQAMRGPTAEDAIGQVLEALEATGEVPGMRKPEPGEYEDPQPDYVVA